MIVNGYKLSDRAAQTALGIRPEPRVPMQISLSAVARAGVKPHAMDAAQILEPYRFAQGIVPAGMAMDAAPASGALSAWAIASALHEGQGFFGFPYLAELMQRAEYRHASQIWAEHAVRKWIKFTGGTDAQRKAVEEEFERLDVRDTIQGWLVQGQCYGRGQIFLDFNDADDEVETSVPLRLIPEKISPQRPLARLTIVEPLWSAPGVYSTNNPLRHDFYKPTQWFVYGRKVHGSRLLTIVPNPVSDMLKPAYAFGGLSLTQIMAPYVDNWLRTRQAVSDLVNAFSLVVLHTDLSSAMGPAATGNDLFARLDLMNNLRDNRGSFAIDKDNEDLTNIAVPLGGLHELQSQAQEQMASVARIPISIYLQITPTGLNATSDGETRNFYADVHAWQERDVRPCLQTIFQAAQLSVLGAIVPDMKFEFVPLWEMSDKDRSDIRKTDADADIGYVNAGIVSPEEVRERLSNDETSLYHGVDLTDPPPELPDEGPLPGDEPDDDQRDGPPAQDEFREEDHPRRDDGKFGSGSGGGGGSSSPAAKPAKADKPNASTSSSSTAKTETGEAERAAAVQAVKAALPAPGQLPSAKTVRQPFDTWEKAEKMAKEGQEIFTDKLTTIAKAAGWNTSPGSPDNIGEDFKGGALFIGPLKSKARSLGKVRNDYDGDFSKLKDVVRGTIACSTIEEMADAINAVQAAGLEFVSDPKDNFSKPTPSGYRDVNTLVRLPNGMIAELQFNVTPMIVAKAKVHDVYGQMQRLQRKNGSEEPNDDWDAHDRDEFEQVMGEQKKAYGDAWESAR